MAKAKRQSNNPPTKLPSGRPPSTPDASMTLDEVLEEMLPHYDDDPFAVAKWVNDHLNKKSGLVLRGDGGIIPPNLCATELTVVALITSNGQPTLKVKTDLGRVAPDAPHELSENESGEPNKTYSADVVRPIKLWTVDRKSFEANRPDAPRNRGGRSDKYPHMHIVSAALVYVAVNGAPAKLDGEGGLFEKLELVLEPTEIPGRTTLYAIFNPIWKRVEDGRKRIEEGRKKPKKKSDDRVV